jgi:asparagine synthase (glutamine-hydrolysing)
MCGIAGIYEGPAAVDPAIVRAMVSELLHRGPDGEGFYLDDGIAGGMCRLAIIDVDHGHQPPMNERGDVVVVFNDEIYNHAELRSQLAGSGHRLSSGSDGAVLPHLYEEYGERFVERLNGIFAIALWDARARRLVLGRDRLGVKPLCWSRLGSHFAFAYEVKAPLRDPAIHTALDVIALDQFLTFRFIPSPATPLAAVRRVRPATVLTIAPEGENERLYWSHDGPATMEASVGGLVDRLASWLRHDLEPLLPDVLLTDGGLCRELFRASEMQDMISEHRDGRRDWSRQLFCLLSLGLWHDSFVGVAPTFAAGRAPVRVAS